MGYLKEEEKQRIIEEEELRAAVRKSREDRSTGLAAVLSSICPGLGQMYNLQLRKGSLFYLAALLSVVLLVVGIAGLVRETAVSGDPGFLAEEEALQIDEEGMVVGIEDFDTFSATVPRPGRNLTILIVGLAGLVLSRHFSVRDAVRKALGDSAAPESGNTKKARA